MKKNTTNRSVNYKHFNIGFKKILIGLIIFICIGFLYSSSSVRDEDEVFNELGQKFHQDYTVSSGGGFIFDIKNETYTIGITSFMMLGTDVIYTEDTYYHPEHQNLLHQVLLLEEIYPL